ncbi:MAG: MotA/TolQ/ExbB proton channel family protein [Oscillospiraceae bacterium]|nr:MotA/TolQ/ExbB proton channel family protein [Oscillospiraceae bacterium]
MNLTFIIGSIVAWGMVLFGIISGGEEGPLASILVFTHLPSALIVVGGVFGVLIASFPMEVLKTVPKLVKIAVFPPKHKPKEYIDQIELFAQTARSKGLLALEDPANKCEDVFLKQAIMLVVDANDPDKVRAMLEDSIEFTTERHSVGISVCEKGMALGPAFGMIGTLIGLILMLVTLGNEGSDLGGSMAVALITTFYGSLLANVLFAPLGSALKNAHNKEVLCMQLVVEGVMSIAAGSNPRLIREKLEFMLAKSDVSKGKAAGTV